MGLLSFCNFSRNAPKVFINDCIYKVVASGSCDGAESTFSNKFLGILGTPPFFKMRKWPECCFDQNWESDPSKELRIDY